MIQTLLRTNSIVSFLVMTIYCALLWTPAFWIEYPAMKTDASGLVIAQLFDFQSSMPLVARSVCMLIILLTGLTLQSAVNRSDIRSSMTLEPMFWMIGLNSIFLLSDFPLPILLANLFLLLAFRRLMMLDNLVKPFSISFDSGLFIALAALCNSFYAFGIVAVWILFASNKTLSWRDITWTLIGLFMPFFILAGIRFLMDIPMNQLIPIPTIRPDQLLTFGSEIVFLVCLSMLLFTISLARRLKGLITLGIAQRRIILISSVLFVLCVVIAGLNSVMGQRGMILGILSIPMSLFLMSLFEANKRTLILDMLTVVWILTTIVTVLTLAVKN